MKIKEGKLVEWFIRIALSAGLLSAVADRFGLWSEKVSAWGNWDNFIAYTQKLNPFVPESLIGALGGVATFLEIAFGIALLIPYKTPLIARGTGFLLLFFGLAMTFASSIKSPLDASVFAASGAAFALAVMTKKHEGK